MDEERESRVRSSQLQEQQQEIHDEKNHCVLLYALMLFAALLSRRGAAAEESPPDRISIGAPLPASESACRGISAGSARAWLHRRTRTSPSSTDMRRESVDRLPELAAELVRLKVDIIVVSGGDRRRSAAKKATKTIPIVMTGAAPILSRQVWLKALPVPAVTSRAYQPYHENWAAKRLELLKEAVPKLARVAVLYDPAIRPMYSS